MVERFARISVVSISTVILLFHVRYLTVNREGGGGGAISPVSDERSQEKDSRDLRGSRTERLFHKSLVMLLLHM